MLADNVCKEVYLKGSALNFNVYTCWGSSDLKPNCIRIWIDDKSQQSALIPNVIIFLWHEDITKLAPEGVVGITGRGGIVIFNWH